ncbi:MULTISPECIES: hypothetical protein [unclassified Nitrosomonas]|jgi:hypothetical protein|uniref:hypothetical protein n=1 Tax=unclassified Nitrosomonas TaxID=2609265 RepID=UPI00088220C2|nr:MULTISPECIES: hypothetical protein [unclassified Nitrosomonas]SDH26073.1 hypothetical protein SAMN05428952_100932 [Nitrosomonas sp. Nm132]SDY38147.1 hypothetical protein SAMN05421754_100832 [Nitrosomonas sp. Nm58]
MSGEHFYSCAIVDRNNHPLHDTSMSGLNEKDLQKVADIYNDAAPMNADTNAPYRVVKLFFKD